MSTIPHPFDAETWQQLPEFLGNLPEPVHLRMWGDESASQNEREAGNLLRALAAHFDQLSFSWRPQRINYPYYPVIGLMHGTEEEHTDKGVRLIGLPAGVQLTSLLTGIQSVSFQASTLEAVTRIKLRSLLPADAELRLELITSAADEGGSIMAQHLFNLAVFAPQIRSYLIMGDQFQNAITRYSVRYLPHTVINSRVHLEGVYDEAAILKHIGIALGS